MQPPESTAAVNPAGQSERAGRPVTHQFSRSFARAHGINAAIIAGYLAHRITGTRKRPGEGYRCSINELKSHYSYLSRTAIADALTSLSPDVLTVVPTQNWRSTDHTRHYAFASLALQRSASEDPIYFQIADAEQYGMPCALLLTNLRMRIADERAHQRGSDTYRVSARGLTEHLPLTRSTISRALQRLKKTGVRMHRCQGFDRAFEVEAASVLPAHDAPADSCGPKSDSCDPSPDVLAPNPDVYRTLKGDVTKSSLESFNSYERRPAAPTAERVCFESSAARPNSESGSRACGVTAGQDAVVDDPGEDAATERNAGSVAEPESLPSRSLVMEGEDPFGVLQPFIPPPRQPIPIGLAELRRANSAYWHNRWLDQLLILDNATIKARVVLRDQGAGTVFRWLAIKDDDKLFAVVREAVERCRCPKADLIHEQGRLGVDWCCAEWLVDACRRYLDDKPHTDSGDGPDTVLKVLVAHLPPYYHANQTALEREGLTYLRYGQEVLAERCKSPDVVLEKAVHLSAAEKKRVFENALVSINRTGYLHPCGDRTYAIVTITKDGLKLVRRFFEINPHWKVSDLLEVLDRCLEQSNYLPGGPAGFTERFAIARASHLTFFMRYFERILNELGRPAWVPAVSFPDEWAKREAA